MEIAVAAVYARLQLMHDPCDRRISPSVHISVDAAVDVIRAILMDALKILMGAPHAHHDDASVFSRRRKPEFKFSNHAYPSSRCKVFDIVFRRTPAFARRTILRIRYSARGLLYGNPLLYLYHVSSANSGVER